MAAFEGTSVREVRRGRTRAASFEPTTSPTVRRQVVPNEVPRVEANTDGLGALFQSFDRFFGRTQSALATLAEAEQLKVQQEIVRENERQQGQGISDALSRRERDASLSDDLDYTRAYARTAGKLGGQKLVEDWLSNVYANAQPGDDLLVQTENYLKAEFTDGTGDPDYDVEALAVFKQATDQYISQFRADSVKAVLMDGLLKKDAEVGNAVRNGTLSVEQFSNWVREYRAMDPMNPAQAPARAMAAIISASGNDLAANHRIASFLHMKGTGSHENASFAESFPAQAAEIDAQLAQKYEYARTLESVKAYDAVDELIESATDFNAWEEAITALKAAESRYGKAGRYETSRNKIVTMLQKQGETITALNRIDEMIGGVRDIDVSEVRKYQNEWFKAKGIDPMLQPGAAAQAAARMGVLGEDLKVNMSRALSDFADPQRQAQAFLFWRSLESSTNGSSFAVDNMTGDVKDIYQMTKERFDGNAENLVRTLEWVNENRTEVSEVPSLAEITGKPLTDSLPAAEKRILNAIEKQYGISSWFTRNVHLSPFQREAILDEARKNFAARNKNGKADWEDTLDATVQSLGSRLELLPGENGKYNAVIKTSADFNPETGERNIPFGPAVYNPATGQPENTAETFRNDLTSLASKFPEVLPDTDLVSVGITPELRGTGVYQVFQEGEPLALTLGSTLTIGGEKVTLPDNAQDALAALSEALGPDGERLVLIPFPAADPVILKVGYQPGFTGKRRLTLDEKIELSTPEDRSAFQREQDQRTLDQLDDIERLRF